MVDLRAGVAAAAEHRMGAGEDPLNALAGQLERARVGQVADDQLGAGALQVAGPGAVAHQRTHGVALRQQGQRGGAAEQAGGADDQDHAELLVFSSACIAADDAAGRGFRQPLQPAEAHSVIAPDNPAAASYEPPCKPHRKPPASAAPTST